MTDAPLRTADYRTADVLGAWGSDSAAAREQYDRRSTGDDTLAECVVCGRKVNPARGWAVLLVGGGAAALAVAQWEEYGDGAADRGAMGMWALGSECAKRVPLEYRRPVAEVLAGA